ncbi:peptide-methionine (S)-S-oxide reductase MsrA [Henriciella aquimarina]|uniref:peptide-methionine (S)-S-oxide reductase MsrA n=1 Tax=Henriciella aquimarina TaxID=545261 RepID=UPI000A03D8B7|nr:peptide-methionine (S)-S-oxide reductase MsrA [Henriciella aquimarina]
MKKSQASYIAIIAGVIAAATGFVWSAVADQSRDDAPSEAARLETVILAGGCFWCVEADFDKVEGVVSTISGYSGGDVDNPTYKQVTGGSTGHYEAVKISYDPARVSYEELVHHFFRTIDPTDPMGQFCDKGSSYRTAVFVDSAEERDIVETEISDIEDSGVLPGRVVTKVLDETQFWPAEDYHQNYYRTNPVKYRFYRRGCGRDEKLEKLWGDQSAGH